MAYRGRKKYYPEEKASRLRRLAWAVLASLIIAVVATGVRHVVMKKHRVARSPLAAPRTLARPLRPSETSAVLGTRTTPVRQTEWHPPHVLKTWLTSFRGRTYRVIQLPRCEHLETVISYNPRGETLREARTRLGGIAASTGSFHNPKSMVLADFMQSEGSVVCPARTGRCFVAVSRKGGISISGDYNTIKRDPDFSAIALGQRLVPLMKDGFSAAFMNEITDRMAVGVNANFIFIVSGKTSVWRLSEFMHAQLPIESAINCDGGHVVRGKGPVHLVFRWKQRSDDQAGNK